MKRAIVCDSEKIRIYTECKYGGHSVAAWNELHESEASKASVFCFDNAFIVKSWLFVDLVCFFSLLLRVAVF